MIYKRIAAVILLAGAMTLPSTYSLAAKPDDSAKPQIKTEQKIQAPLNRVQIHDRIKKALDGLVKDGTITQDQEDAVLKAMEERWQNLEKKMKEIEKGGSCKDSKGRHCSPKDEKKHGVLRELVKNGTITQEQAEAIRKAIKSVHENMDKS